jgi:uncharacterized protein (DUF433 family)
MTQPKTYVWMNDCGTLKVGRSDVSLDSVVYAHRGGARPEVIHDQFPTLTLEETYGALAYYCANREEVDRYLEEQINRFEKLREAAERNPSPVLERLTALRREAKVETP